MRDSLIVFVFFAVGVALGYADAVPTWLLDPDLPMIILSVMVVLVGLGLGAGDNLHYMLRTFNWRMLLLPLCTIVGTLRFSALGVLVLRGFSLTDCLAVGSGFGYYSLSSVLIADLKSDLSSESLLQTCVGADGSYYMYPISSSPFYMGLNSNDKLAKDLGVNDNITIGICCKPKDGTAYMSLKIDGSSDSGTIEKMARLLLNSQKKVEQRMREAYAQEGVVEEAAYLEPDDYENFE